VRAGLSWTESGQVDTVQARLILQVASGKASQVTATQRIVSLRQNRKTGRAAAKVKQQYPKPRPS
jgi:hypothetical protein